MLTIPIILLNYNSSSDCRKCISFLKNQKNVEIEIVVVDNCSKSEDLCLLRTLCQEEQCTLIENKENRGYNARNNIGLRYAVRKGYKYALITNPDMEFPQEEYLKQLVDVMEEQTEVVVIGSDIVTPEGIHQNPMMHDGNWKSSWRWIISFFKQKREDTYDFIDAYEHSHYCAKVSGCCLLVRLDFIRKIDFFDESVFLYCEEAILSRQVEIAERKIYYNATVQAIHKHVKNEKGNPAKRFKYWKESRIYYINRYSSYSWYGKWLSGISMRLYVTLMQLYYKIR